MTPEFDVAIAGGGLVGTLTGVALAEHGLSVVILDRRAGMTQADDFDGRAYALSAASIAMFRALGLWDLMAERAEPILDIKVSDGRPGEGAAPFFLHFDHREMDEGPFGHMLEDRFLRRAFLDRIGELDGLAFRDEANITGWSEGRLETTRGPVTARLVIAADGRQSPVATAAGIRRTGWDYNQTSLVCAVGHDLPHEGVAHQFFAPDGPLAILPLPGNRSSIVWTKGRAEAERLQSGPEESYLAALRPVFGDFLGDIRLEGARYAYPLGLSLAETFVAPRLALVGDAAHGIHPLAGQGFNLGVRDAASLAEVLVDATRRGEDIGAPDVLLRYQQWRRFDTNLMAAFTDGINRLFSNDNPLLRAARDLGMGAVQRMPALRRAFMREAAGLTGHRPRLLTGRAL